MHGLGRYLAPLVLLATPAGGQEFDPASLDIAALIECRADVPAYNEFAIWLSSAPGAVEALGWKKIDSGNPFLSQYELPAKIHVFDRETESIVFTASGPMAVLDGIDAPDLAKELGVIARCNSRHVDAGEIPRRESRCRNHRENGRIGPLDEDYAQRLDCRVASRQDAGRLLLHFRRALKFGKETGLLAYLI